jgi:hypothetical protein
MRADGRCMMAVSINAHPSGWAFFIGFENSFAFPCISQNLIVSLHPKIEIKKLRQLSR